jgi:hypothetical protein
MQKREELDRAIREKGIMTTWLNDTDEHGWIYNMRYDNKTAGELARDILKYPLGHPQKCSLDCLPHMFLMIHSSPTTQVSGQVVQTLYYNSECPLHGIFRDVIIGASIHPDD